MVEFEKRFPSRYFDVGIAEQHAVTFAGGLACEGLKPVVAIYSTFLQRGYDQLIHDVALQNLPVVFALDRAGVVGADGPTHAGAYDIPYLRCIPNMSVACPADENECRRLLTSAFEQNHPVAVRYPRGAGVGAAMEPGLDPLPFGKGEVRREGTGRGHPGLRHLAVPGAGRGRAPRCHGGEHALGQAPRHRAAAAGRGTARGVGHGGRGRHHGRRGQCCGRSLARRRRCSSRCCSWACRDEFIEHGDPAKLLALQGLDAAGIEAAVRERFGDLVERTPPALKVVARLSSGLPGAAGDG